MICLLFHSMGYLRRTIAVIAVLGLLAVLTGAAQAETVDYLADKVFVETKVNTASLYGKTVKLSDVVALVESQTNLKFFYVADRIPVGGEMTFEGASVMSLADFFSTISSLANVVFQRHQQTIVIRRAIPKSDND